MPLTDFILEGVLRADGVTPQQIAAAQRLLAFIQGAQAAKLFQDVQAVAPAVQMILKRSQNKGVG